MPDTRTLNTVLEICGLECRVEVEYKITSYGTPDSWEEPGDPPECEILSVVDTDTGRDWYPYASRTIANPADLKVTAYLSKDGYVLDPMTCAVVGLPRHPYIIETVEPGVRSKQFYHYRTEFRVEGDTVLDRLYEEIYADGDSFVYDEPDDYDPRDYA